MPSRIRRRRLTRARLLAAGVVAVAAGVEVLRGAIGTESAKSYTVAFGSAADRSGWPAPWVAQHYRRRMAVEHGHGVFELPAGLPSAAPAQPMPVFLLDHACGDASHLLAFSVTNASLRPGVLLAATSDVDYAAVTCERGRLVLARYATVGRTVVAEARAPTLVAGTGYRLRLSVHGPTVRAKLWANGAREPGWQLHAHAGPLAEGTPGVLVVHPLDFRPAALRVSSYALAAERAFRPTAPVAAATITGVPLHRPDGRYDLRLRVISAFPARATFHVEHGGTRVTLPPQDALEPPYAALGRVTVAPGEHVRWQAELEAAGTGVRTLSGRHELVAQHPRDRLVLFATSCAQFSGVPESRAFAALDQAAPARAAAMVFQGDLGYANNIFHSCYLSAPDFFADRFRRQLAGHDFAGLRSRVPTGFTIDDHDYGPRNNADRTTYAHWAPPLWDRIHADPDPAGYFDFRFGDVHCLTLDVRRYADPVDTRNSAAKTRIGAAQFGWMQGILETSDARMFVILSAGIFASRYHVDDCWLTGWPDEYDRAMRLFMGVQARGARVLILSGDAHGMRIHHHPYPQRIAPRGPSVVEFVCSGVRPRVWSGAQLPDPTLDPRRNVLGRYGGGMLAVDAPDAAARRVTLRAISGNVGRPGDLFPPLVLPFEPV